MRRTSFTEANESTTTEARHKNSQAERYVGHWTYTTTITTGMWFCGSIVFQSTKRERYL